MITKAEKKLIKSLAQKKNRDNLGLFLAEGEKLLTDLADSGFIFKYLFTTNPSADIGEAIPKEITVQEMFEISNLTHPSPYLAVVVKPELNKIAAHQSLIVALDGVQDPGNLGTIIRLCDWFGVSVLLCSKNCADAFATKVVQASMGAITRVAVHYVDLHVELTKLKAQGKTIYGTFLDGSPLVGTPILENAVIVMGSEGQGISAAIEQLVHHKILIPQHHPELFSESLNVATATAIVLYEWRR